MNRIHKAFENGKALIGFITAGDPSLEKTEEYILQMVRAGCDLVEIGIPFSDPIAEGIVIQEADLRALQADTTTDGVFDMVEDLRQKTDVPLVFMTYYNPVFSYGNERFFDRCRKVGIDGIIVPDLPYEEKGEIQETARKNDVKVISMIVPTSHERIRRITGDSEGFLYIVSSMGVTGMRSQINTGLASILKEARESTQTPAAVGFDINTPEQVKKIGSIADGVIVGSAIVKLAERYGDNAGGHIYAYVKSMKDILREI
ncbi:MULTISPECIES: tryptophan synthase subunit alpha [Caproicibacterium]|jgi:tryptophan synthase alpha chain|uniref:Tryptophan synthase alpha chain n=1 Tax=Caproicibacterium lactatifermentans TaxID=2666138 RepID=A0A859DSL0_9FIRM|nr:tryptophan synthase subunit alpha [Caproicibacterium lactatifermentans]ARP51166.1 tryptophan synthase subunit alpha [Ruminococcaceae bacterium CPB6]MDD4806971.1 tryptophan synthase subunit alpha [Oscillospiraceae bacterium]QKN24664.1 tryptophan synthase subunit alpha [Caproicibacterium lactatifermentans]QKO30163.1 tryptophan synthase subunit alpha [Caproicibacterium lactatifermentans]